jgi:hypothetical protein
MPCFDLQLFTPPPAAAASRSRPWNFVPTLPFMLGAK